MATHFRNGSIYLGNSNWATEIYIKDGLVISSEEYLASAEREEVDLNGNTLLPAFRDGHAHPLFAGKEIQSLNITGCESSEEIGKRLTEHRNSNPNISWISGGAYDRSIIGQADRNFLDSFVSDVPVVLSGDDHHTIWVNTKALEVAGLISGVLPKTKTGSIDVDEAGIPTGFLREFEATELIQRHEPAESVEERIQHLLSAEELLLAAGIVEVQDAWIDSGMAEIFFAAEHQLKLDYKLLVRADANSPAEVFRYLTNLANRIQPVSKVQIQGIKFFIDGVFGSATALVSEAYVSTGKHGDCNWTFDELKEAIDKTHNLGLQSHLHAIGDAAIEFALNAVSAASKGPLGPVIAHAELTNETLLEKAKALDVTLCLQPYWAQNNGMLLSCVPHIGEERTQKLYAIRDMLASGVKVAFGSDWPVSSYKPLEGIAVAIHRRSSNEVHPHNPTQAINLDQAIDCYTAAVRTMLGGVAKGTLEVGQAFDAVVLSGDLREKDLDGLLTTEVLSVYKSGARLFPHN